MLRIHFFNKNEKFVLKELQEKAKCLKKQQYFSISMLENFVVDLKNCCSCSCFKTFKLRAFKLTSGNNLTFQLELSVHILREHILNENIESGLFWKFQSLDVSVMATPHCLPGKS